MPVISTLIGYLFAKRSELRNRVREAEEESDRLLERFDEVEGPANDGASLAREALEHAVLRRHSDLLSYIRNEGRR